MGELKKRTSRKRTLSAREVQQKAAHTQLLSPGPKGFLVDSLA